jgi:Ribbon-helix-helix protein, copG family
VYYIGFSCIYESNDVKKSEKIEIRISYEEKKKLTRLAEREGYSVSELVRGLARKYAQLYMPTSHLKISRWHMVGLVLGGIVIGSGLILSLSKNSTSSRGAQFMVHGVINNNGFGFGVENNAENTESIKLGNGVGAFKIELTVKNGEGNENVAKIFICKQSEDICVKSAQVDLNVNRDNSPSVWQTMTETGESLFLVIQPI